MISHLSDGMELKQYKELVLIHSTRSLDTQTLFFGLRKKKLIDFLSSLKICLKY